MIQGIEKELNLPKAELNFKNNDDSGSQLVFDRVRNKWVPYTPEERVRLHFVNWLVEHRNYPIGRIGNEITVNHNGHRRRCDTVVYDSTGSPVMIIEYKSPDVKIDRNVFDQISRYNIVMGTPWLIVSNGLTHYCCKVEKKGCRFMNDIPSYENLKNPD